MYVYLYTTINDYKNISWITIDILVLTYILIYSNTQYILTIKGHKMEYYIAISAYFIGLAGLTYNLSMIALSLIKRGA